MVFSFKIFRRKFCLHFNNDSNTTLSNFVYLGVRSLCVGRTLTTAVLNVEVV